MRSIKVLACMVIISFVTSSCCTVISGKTENISFSSDPVGADVYIDQHKKGTTPMELEVNKKNNLHVKITKEGYKDAIFLIKQSVNPLLYLSYVCLVVPALVDYGTGAMWNLDPTKIDVTMEPEGK